MDLALKALAGALAVVLIQVLARARTPHLAGLVPLFPTFALIAHAIVGTQSSPQALKTTIRFGMWALIPYLVSLYLLADHCRLSVALGIAVLCWLVAAGVLIALWGPR